MRKIFLIMAPLLVVIGAFIVTGLLIEAKPQTEKNIEPPRATSLYVEESVAENVILPVRTQGEVRPKTQIDLIPQVGGRIISVSENFVEGGRFEAGEILVQIDPSDYELAVTRAEAQVAAASVTLEQELADARIKEKQWEEWVNEGEPTPLALNKPQVAEAQAALRAAEASMKEARLNLARTSITAPFAGRVISRDAGPGQVVSGGPNSILGVVFATDIVEIRLPLSDRQLADLALPIGYEAKDKSGPMVTFSARVGGLVHNWQGEIKRINASVDNQTRLVYAIAEVNDPYGDSASTMGMPIAVGLFVDAEISGIHSRDVLAIPRPALRNEDTVFVVGEDNKLEIRKIQILSSSTEKAWILAGLQPGEQVVVSPVLAPRDGMDVVPIYKASAGGVSSDAARAKSR